MLQKFDQCAEQYGEKIAVRYQNQTVTYQDLRHRINQLSNYLKSRGIKPGSVVGFCLDRGIEALVSLLAIIRTEATYIPLDPAYPIDRLEFMLSETQPAFILTQSQTLARLPKTSAIPICIDTEQQEINSSHTNVSTTSNILTTSVSTDTLAYIMYTSGSTGRPKGVEMPLSSLSLYLQSIGEVLQIQPEDVYLHTASFSFSSSIRQLLIPLSYGATVLLTSQGQSKSPFDLLALMKKNHVTISDTVASVWRSVLQAVKSLNQNRQDELLTNSLRLVLLSGALTPCSVLQKIKKSLKSQPQIINIYGQTETIGVCAYRVPRAFDPQQGYVPVGFPYDHNRVYILDEAMQPLAQGEVGELYISGGCLSRGYLNRPELTTKQFLANPWANEVANAGSRFSRLYKSGDLARFLPDGSLEIRGRADFQVKIRGMRVELGEIEQAIEALDIAKEAIVLSKEDFLGEQQLVAYVVPQPDYVQQASQEFASQIKQALQQKLTDYLIPTLIIKLKQLPLTPNGKRDRLSLPAPDWSLLSTSKTDQQPKTETEKKLFQLWTQLFGFNPGLQDSFFDLGGNSLMAVRLFADIEREFAQSLSFHQLLKSSSIQTLAAYIESKEATVEKASYPRSVVPIHLGTSATPIFCTHVLGENCSFYKPMVAHLADQTLYGLSSVIAGDSNVPHPQNIRELALYYADQIQTVQPQGPYALLGVSFGGIIAYETAQVLWSKGEKVNFLGLLDTYCRPLESKLVSLKRVLSYYQQKLRHYYSKYLQGRIQNLFKIEGEVLAKEKSRIQQRIKPGDYNRINQGYAIQPYPGKLTLFRAREDADPKKEWHQLAGKNLNVVDIPGDHLTMLNEPNVKYIAESIHTALAPNQSLLVK